MVFTGYRVTSNFGYRNHPIDKVRKLHKGIDLVKYHKAPINAFVGGTVHFSGWNSQGFGNLVIIIESNGFKHYYAHLNSVNVKKGQKVSKGQVIGYQGTTGNSTGSHLHYEVRNKSNVSINPRTYLENKKGVKRMVKKIKEDGIAGKETWSRLQQFLGTPVDGILSKPKSTMILALQKFLNSYGQ